VFKLFGHLKKRTVRAFRYEVLRTISGSYSKRRRGWKENHTTGNSYCILCTRCQSNPCRNRSWEFQDLWTPKFQANRHM